MSVSKYCLRYTGMILRTVHNCGCQETIISLTLSCLLLLILVCLPMLGFGDTVKCDRRQSDNLYSDGVLLCTAKSFTLYVINTFKIKAVNNIL